MKSLEELNNIKERTLQQRNKVGGDTRVRVVVALGTCGIAAGAGDTMAAILSEIKKRDISNVTVTQTGCMGLCEFEPIVRIQVGGSDVVTYANISQERVAALIESHVLKGETMTEWLVK